MERHGFQIPAQRQRQFDLIRSASDATLEWARSKGMPLVRIDPVVPFVETEFSLDAWFFLHSEDQIRSALADGSADTLVAQFRAELEKAGYPDDWLRQVSCHFGSKEIVDRAYEGSFFYFLR